MQSVNEELIIANNQLNEKIEELSKTNDGLANFLNSSEVGTIFLDTHFCVRRFTPSATKLLNLIPLDVGRPVSHISNNLIEVDLTAAADNVLKSLLPVEKEVQASDGCCYMMRCIPYRTLKNQIDGVVFTFTDVSRLKHSEEAMLEAKNYAENIINTTRESLLVLDPQLKVVSANRAFYETFQVSPEETENRLIYEIGNHRWDIPKLREVLEKVLPRDTVLEDFEVEQDFPSIGRRIMRLNARRVAREANQTRLILLAIEDITKQKRAEEALRESAGQLQAVVETAVDAIITITEGGMIGTFNAAAERIFGYKSEEAVGRNVNLLMPEPYHSEHDSYLSNYLHTGECRIIGIGRELQGLRKDGSIFPLELAVSETKLHDRRIFTGIIRDITNRKRAESRLAAKYAVTRALAESRTVAEASVQILQTIGETLGWEFGALWTVDHDAKARCMKTWHLASKHYPEFDAISHQLTFSPGIGLVGRIWASKEPAWVPDVVNDNNFPRAPMAAKENLHGAFGFPIRIGHEVLGVMEFFSHEIRQPDEALLKMVGVIGSEIGQFIERLRTEEQLRNLNEELENRVAKRTADLQQANAALLRDMEERGKLEKQLRENERLTSLGLVIAKVAHEIANPLNGIYTSTQLLERHFKAHQENVDKQVIEIATDLRSETERLKSLLEEIRSFSSPNLQCLELEPADLSVLAVEVLTREMTNYTERGIRIEHDFPAELPPVMIDRKKMVQVLFNLYKNAVEAMPEGGTLTVRGYRSGEYVCLDITDTGVGIPKDLDVFEPFSTTKPTGMGIGLVVVRQIVSAHGGSINYTSEASKGTVFRIGLPLSQ